MKCSEYRPRIALNVGGDLPPSQSERLQLHLEQCAECRTYRSEIESSYREVRKLRVDRVEEVSLARVRKAVLHRTTGSTPRGAWKPSIRPSYLATATAVAALAFAAFGVFVTLQRTKLDTYEILATRTSAIPTAVPLDSTTADTTSETSPSEPDMQPAAQPQFPLTEPTPKHAVVARAMSPQSNPPVPASIGNPTIVRLVSDDSKVVIYWQIDPETTPKES